MSQKMMSPLTTLVWVPESGVVDPLQPKADELNAGVNFSCAVVRGYTVNPTASDTDTTASICDNGNVENRTYANYEGSITIFRDANRADITSVFNIAWALWRQAGSRGFIYRRVGKRNTLPFVLGDEVEGFLFESDNPQSIDGTDGGGPIQATIPFLQQGNYTGYVFVGPLVAPVITTLSVTTGPTVGGTEVLITGTGLDGVTAVRFGGTPATAPLVQNSTSIRVISPAHVAGVVDVRATNAKGTSVDAAGTKYTYE